MELIEYIDTLNSEILHKSIEEERVYMQMTEQEVDLDTLNRQAQKIHGYSGAFSLLRRIRQDVEANRIA